MYPDTTQPSAPVALDHERSTSPSPEVGVTVGIVTVGNVKKPALRVKLLVVDILIIPNSPRASSNMKLVEVDRPPAVLITGSIMLKEALLKTSALTVECVKRSPTTTRRKSTKTILDFLTIHLF